jgi:hypothetical protein
VSARAPRRFDLPSSNKIRRQDEQGLQDQQDVPDAIALYPVNPANPVHPVSFVFSFDGKRPIASVAQP